MSGGDLGLPEPRPQPLRRHLGRFTAAPLPLLEEGARTTALFQLRLWRPAVVGYTADWNRLVLKDTETFRSTGSLSSRSPYLNGGTIARDAPLHRPARRALNPSFSRTSVATLGDRFAEIARTALPVGEFDALAWSSRLVQRMLSAAFFDERFPPDLLARFLRPLGRAVPAPLIRRPTLFRRMNHALDDAIESARPATLAHDLRELDGVRDEIRVALAAGYDTTTHTMAWALWHLAGRTPGIDDAGVTRVIDETLRLYPSGWLGSRVTARAVEVGGTTIPAGTLVMYSPYLTHRDPTVWPDPLRFRPDRFLGPVPPWGYIPFLAGARTCLGAHLARLMLRTALSVFADRPLVAVRGDPRPRVTLTLAPTGPLVLRRS